ncbi:hypothetical protein FWH13_00855 [Candidatus Saccharibacteria bacterium]|nr:hypothetical protein [Candidatus Saccharibacteria bacterium]
MGEAKPLIEWQAAEYFVRKKGKRWFVGFGFVAIILLAGAIWLRAWTFAALIVVAVIAFIVYSRSTPDKIRYAILKDGVEVGDKTYPYDTLKVFGVIEDGTHYYIRIVPKRRFAGAILMYFAKQDGEKIVDTLGSRLQMEKMSPDPLDKLLQKLKI